MDRTAVTYLDETYSVRGGLRLVCLSILVCGGGLALAAGGLLYWTIL